MPCSGQVTLRNRRFLKIAMIPSGSSMIPSGPINSTFQSPSFKDTTSNANLSLPETRPAKGAVEQDLVPNGQKTLVENKTNLPRALINLASYNEPVLSERPSEPSGRLRPSN